MMESGDRCVVAKAGVSDPGYSSQTNALGSARSTSEVIDDLVGQAVGDGFLGLAHLDGCRRESGGDEAGLCDF